MSEIRRSDGMDLDHYVKHLEAAGLTPAKGNNPSLGSIAKNNVTGFDTVGIPSIHTGGIILSQMTPMPRSAARVSSQSGLSRTAWDDSRDNVFQGFDGDPDLDIGDGMAESGTDVSIDPSANPEASDEGRHKFYWQQENGLGSYPDAGSFDASPRSPYDPNAEIPRKEVLRGPRRVPIDELLGRMEDRAREQSTTPPAPKAYNGDASFHPGDWSRPEGSGPIGKTSLWERDYIPSDDMLTRSRQTPKSHTDESHTDKSHTDKSHHRKSSSKLRRVAGLLDHGRPMSSHPEDQNYDHETGDFSEKGKGMRTDDMGGVSDPMRGEMGVDGKTCPQCGGPLRDYHPADYPEWAAPMLACHRCEKVFSPKDI